MTDLIITAICFIVAGTILALGLVSAARRDNDLFAPLPGPLRSEPKERDR